MAGISKTCQLAPKQSRWIRRKWGSVFFEFRVNCSLNYVSLPEGEQFSVISLWPDVSTDIRHHADNKITTTRAILHLIFEVSQLQMHQSKDDFMYFS